MPTQAQDDGMRLTEGKTIAGYPALAIRRLLRQSREPLHPRNLYNLIKLPTELAHRLIADLQELGYLGPSDETSGWLKNTVKGNAVANASAARGITRATAKRLVRELAARARLANRRAFAYAVRQIWVFGSYLTDRAVLGDVDVVIELVPRDTEHNWERGQERVRRARRAGRRFDSLGAEIMWPTNEVLLFLRGKSPYISLHDPKDGILASVEKKLIFQDLRVRPVREAKGGG